MEPAGYPHDLGNNMKQPYSKDQGCFYGMISCEILGDTLKGVIAGKSQAWRFRWENLWEKNGKMGVSGRICLYVACYDFVLGFNVSSSPLMFFQVGFWG